MTYARNAVALGVALALTGCGMADARRQLAESHARLQAAILADVRAGRLTPEQGEDELDEMGSLEAKATAPVQSVTFVPATTEPAFQPRASYMPPPEPYSPTTPAPAFNGNYTGNPSPPPPQFIPYQAVAPLMPGINPSGTAR